MASTSSSWLYVLGALAALVQACSLDSRKLVPDLESDGSVAQGEEPDAESPEPPVMPSDVHDGEGDDAEMDAGDQSDAEPPNDEANGEVDAGDAAACCRVPTDPSNACLALDEEACHAEAARLEQVRKMVRVVTRAPAFAQCLNAAMRIEQANQQIMAKAVPAGGCGHLASYGQTGHGPYVSCRPEADSSFGGRAGGTSSGDPAWNEIVDRRWARAINAAQIDIELALGPGTAEGAAAIASGYDPERGTSHVDYTGELRAFTLSQALGQQDDTLGLVPAVIRASLHNLGYDDGCRTGEPPLGTDHGNCGRDPVTWNPDRSLSHLAAFCAKEVLLRSTVPQVHASPGCGTEGSGASEMPRSCPQGGLMLVSVYMANPFGIAVPCHCVPDPEQFGHNTNLDEYGTALAVGDFDGDGIGDLAVGAPGKRYPDVAGQGAVVLYRGSMVGLRPLRSLRAADLGVTADDARCGAALAAGDFDGDQVSELVVGCPDYNGAEGIVVVVPGCKERCDGAQPGPQILRRQQLLPAAPGEFGFALATGKLLGDDELDDLAIGAPGASSTVAFSGKVELYRGRNTGVLLRRERELLGQDSMDRFGATLAIGDVQATPGAELIVGAPERNGHGVAYVDSSTGMAPLVTPALQTGAKFGSAIAIASVYGVEFSDIFIAAPEQLAVYRSVGASAGPGPAGAVLNYAPGLGFEPKALAFIATYPDNQIVVGQPGANEVIAYRLIGGGLGAGTRLSPKTRPFWSADHDALDGGHCTARGDTPDDIACQIDGIATSGSRFGAALAAGPFAIMPQIAIGSPGENPVTGPPIAAGAAYVRGGLGDFELFPDADAQAYFEPVEYRLDQTSTLAGGVYQSRRFGAAAKWHDAVCEAGETCMLFNGYPDLVVFSKDSPGKEGDVWVASRSDPSAGPGSFGALQLWHDSFCTGQEICNVTDTDANGVKELIAFVGNATPGHEGHVHVARCPNCAIEEWHHDLCRPGTICKLHTHDSAGATAPCLVIEFNPGAGTYRMAVAVPTRSRFELTNEIFNGTFCAAGDECQVADVDGDSDPDIIDFRRSAGGEVWVSLGFSPPGATIANSFGAPQRWHPDLCTRSRDCRLADVNRDDFADLVAFDRGTTPDTDGEVWVALSNRNEFGPAQKWHDDLCRAGQTCLLGDMDGDHRADVVVLTRSTQGQEHDAYVALSLR
jgi:hypothetical protein